MQGAVSKPACSARSAGISSSFAAICARCAAGTGVRTMAVRFPAGSAMMSFNFMYMPFFRGPGWRARAMGRTMGTEPGDGSMAPPGLTLFLKGAGEPSPWFRLVSGPENHPHGFLTRQVRKKSQRETSPLTQKRSRRTVPWLLKRSRRTVPWLLCVTRRSSPVRRNGRGTALCAPPSDW